MQALGNVCLSLAGILYLIPLQHLLLEFARKRDDGGGAIAGGLILIPMWALLLVGLLLATSRGGFDWLLLQRGALYVLVTAATLALVVVTFLSLVQLGRPTWTARLIYGWPIYVIPPLTGALVAWVLNPGLAAKVSPAFIRVPWTVLAGISLCAVTGSLGYRIVKLTGSRVMQVIHTLGTDRDLERRNLALVPTLEPERDFADLLSLANSFNSAEVRALATARLRTHPQFVDALVIALGETDPSKALDFIAGAEFSAAELQRLAEPARAAMFRLSKKVHEELRYTPAARQKLLRRWGQQVYRGIATRFALTELDFNPAIAAFDGAFVPDPS